MILAAPYTIEYEDDNLYADLLAQKKTLLAQQQDRKIVVEIKSFLNPSPMNDFQNALGQYLLYRDFLNFSHKNYELYLAVKSSVFNSFFFKENLYRQSSNIMGLILSYLIRIERKLSHG